MSSNPAVVRFCIYLQKYKRTNCWERLACVSTIQGESTRVGQELKSSHEYNARREPSWGRGEKSMLSDPWSALQQYRPANKRNSCLEWSLRLPSVAQDQVTFTISRFLSTLGVETCVSCINFSYLCRLFGNGVPSLPRILDGSECWEWQTKTATCSHQQETARY